MFRSDTSSYVRTFLLNLIDLYIYISPFLPLYVDMQQRNGDTDLFESQTDICGGLDGSTWVAEDKAFNSERLATLRQPQVKPRNMRQGVKKNLGLRCVRRTKTFQFKVLE